MIAGLASPAGSGFLTEIRANTEAALSNMSAQEGRTENAAEGAGKFEQEISELYDHSMSATDEEVLASAKMMESDFEAVEKELGDEAGGLIDYLKYYEAAKSSYIAGDSEENMKFSDGILHEWTRQGEYTSYVMPATDIVHTMVPRIKVTDCSVKDGSADLSIYEWMTVGYAPEDAQEVNATAYGYNFSLKVDRDRKGNWTVASVGGTDQNFDWMQEEADYAAQAAAEEAGDGRRVLSDDGSMEMMAASAAASYSYNVSNAIAYADKYCINYNGSYNSYKGRGGDCANFVSQCLYAGGFKQDSVWYRHSVAWINVMKQIAHFKAYGTFLNANNSNLIKGNPIYFDWNGDGVYDHATICVGRNSNGVAILDSHTKDLYHATWNNWSFRKAGTIQLRGSGSSSTTSGGSFKTDSKGRYYKNADGSRLKSCFQTINGKRYYFKSDGYVATGHTKIGGKYYIFDAPSGVMCTGWTTYNGKKYYLGSNGAAYTEWNEIGGKWYYFSPSSGKMATGFARVKTKLHYFGTNGVEQFGWITANGKKYHTDEYGVVQSGWQTIGGKKYFFDPKYAMVTGNVRIDGVVYTFDKNGVCKGKSETAAASRTIDTTTMTSTTTTTTKKSGKTGWEEKDGKWYYYKNGSMLKNSWLTLGSTSAKRTFYLNQNGVMQTGWKTINGYRYYFNSEGVRQTGWLKYKSAWYYLQSNGRMRTGWLKIGTRYFYMQKDGKMKTGWLKDTDGETYYLDSEGVMVTGRRVIGGKTYYFNNSGALID